MDLSIVIVSWNVREKLRENLHALFQSEGDFKYEVFVVDNASQDGSADLVREKFPQVKLIINSDNLGFAKANNQALRLASGKFVLLLNPDMRVSQDTLARALSWAQTNPQATVAGCRLVNEQGEIVKQVRRFPKFFDQLLIILKLPHIFPRLLDKYLCARFNYSQPRQVDSIRGAFFLINTENYQRISNGAALRLDERYFIWFEEVDFCRQIAQWGGQVWYTPAAECLDYVGQSFKQVARTQTQSYFRDSMLKYFKKWGKPWQVRILAGAWKVSGIFIK